jgi:hypothetical protein
MMNRNFNLALIAAALLSQACAKPTENKASVFAVESAMAAVAAHAGASEGGSLALQFDPSVDWASADYVNPTDSLHPMANDCTYSSARSTCVSGTTQINWNGCTSEKGRIVYSGGWSESYSGTNANACTVPAMNGGVINRKTSGSSVASGGLTLKTDTNGGTAYDGTNLAGYGVVIKAGPTARAIEMNGVHRVLSSAKDSAKWSELYLQTTSSLVVLGTRAGYNRVISSGAVRVFDEMQKFTALSDFNSVSWGSASCCYPTGGRITTSLTGSIEGTTVLDFSLGAKNCGQASFTDVDGKISKISLAQCE